MLGMIAHVLLMRLFVAEVRGGRGGRRLIRQSLTRQAEQQTGRDGEGNQEFGKKAAHGNKC